jgi:hypothetical protein
MGHSNDTRPRRTALAIARHRKTREITAVGGKGTTPIKEKKKSNREREIFVTNLFLTLVDDLLLQGHQHRLGDRS